MFSIATAALCALTPLISAQQEPYSEGNVHEFLEQARTKGRPAIVLFNFNLETG